MTTPPILDATYDPTLHDDHDDIYLTKSGCWPIVVMVVLGWVILAWLGYVAWLIFGNPGAFL